MFFQMQRTGTVLDAAIASLGRNALFGLYKRIFRIDPLAVNLITLFQSARRSFEKVPSALFQSSKDSPAFSVWPADFFKTHFCYARRPADMTEYAITFGQCLERWMHAHHLTSASLAAMTGARSATSISRLRRDQCTPKLCQTFLDTLLTLPDGRLSPEEARQFRTALEYTRGSLTACRRKAPIAAFS